MHTALWFHIWQHGNALLTQVERNFVLTLPNSPAPLPNHRANSAASCTCVFAAHTALKMRCKRRETRGRSVRHGNEPHPPATFNAERRKHIFSLLCFKTPIFHTVRFVKLRSPPPRQEVTAPPPVHKILAPPQPKDKRDSLVFGAFIFIILFLLASKYSLSFQSPRCFAHIHVTLKHEVKDTHAHTHAHTLHTHTHTHTHAHTHTHTHKFQHIKQTQCHLHKELNWRPLPWKRNPPRHVVPKLPSNNTNIHGNQSPNSS